MGGSLRVSALFGLLGAVLSVASCGAQLAPVPQEAGLIESGPPVDAARPFDAASRDGDVVPDATTIEATDGGASASPEASTNDAVAEDAAGAGDAGAGDAGAGDAGGRDVGCILKACAQLGFTCGLNSDGCGGSLNCGICNAPDFCGGGGFSRCGSGGASDSGGEDGGGICTPRTCGQLGYDCGTAGDGCGGILTCGTCAPPDTCSGGGGYNHCGKFSTDGGTCLTCADLPGGAECSARGDGCGHLVAVCGNGANCSLPPYGTCGGGGIPFRCGTGASCPPITCAELNYDCGSYGDGCGGVLDCGTCTTPQFCGGGGFNRCGPTDAGVDGG